MRRLRATPMMRRSRDERAWQHPWLRIVRIVRGIQTTYWDGARWRVARQTLRDAVIERERIRLAGWFN